MRTSRRHSFSRSLNRVGSGAVLAASLLGAGCARSPDAGVDSGGATASGTHGPLGRPATVSGTDTATLITPRGPAFVSGDSAPGAGDVSAEPLQWTGDAVVQRLADAGLAPVQRGTVRQPDLGMNGLRLSVANGAAEVQAFIFGDADAVGNATRHLDPARLASGGRSASIVTDNNLGAIVLTSDEKVRQRIASALVARRGGR